MPLFLVVLKSNEYGHHYPCSICPLLRETTTTSRTIATAATATTTALSQLVRLTGIVLSKPKRVTLPMVRTESPKPALKKNEYIFVPEAP